MKILDLGNCTLFGTEGSGNQKKAWITADDGLYLVKLNSKYREANKEVSAGILAEACGIESVQYNASRFRFKGTEYNGCICKNYLKQSESSIPLYKIILDIDVYRNTPTSMFFKQTVDAVCKYTKLPEKQIIAYFMQILTFDYLICNSDRHLNNIEFIYNEDTQRFRTAPMFDCGKSFLGRDGMISNKEMIQEIHKYKSMSFSTNPEKNLIDINYAREIAEGFLANIKDTYTSVYAIPINDFHKKLFNTRINTLLK